MSNLIFFLSPTDVAHVQTFQQLFLSDQYHQGYLYQAELFDCQTKSEYIVYADFQQIMMIRRPLIPP